MLIMRIRYLVLIISVFLSGIFVAGASFAHPPNLHKDKAPEQTQSVDKATGQEHAEMNMDDQHNSGASKTAGQDHEGQGHEGQGHAENGHDDEECDETSEAGGHSHWGISPDSSPFSKKMAALGKFHPLLVHFPIALLLTAAFAQALNIKNKDGAYDRAVTLLVWCATLGAIVAGLLGWAHSGPAQAGENGLMSSHRWIGTLLLLGTPLLVWFMRRAARADGGLSKSTMFSVMLFGFALAVAIQGFLGGSLAHGGVKHLMPGMM